MTLRERVLQIIEETLAKNNGNKAKTARELGVVVRTIRNWLKTKKTQGIK